MTPYYSRDGITIYCGDNAKILPMLFGIDLIITSPPYNLGVTTGGGFPTGKKTGIWGGAKLANGYELHDDAMPPDDYRIWQRNFLTMAWRTLSPTGAIYYNHKPRVQGGLLQTPLEFNPGLPLRQVIIWKRAGGVNFSQTHYLPTHEWILLLAKEDFRLKSKGASGVGDVWEFPQESNNPHPAPFPIGLPARVIESTNANIICDPFSGSGTTLRAAKDAGKMAIGIELSESYCEMAIERLKSPSFFSLPTPQPEQLTLGQL